MELQNRLTSTETDFRELQDITNALRDRSHMLEAEKNQLTTGKQDLDTIYQELK